MITTNYGRQQRNRVFRIILFISIIGFTVFLYANTYINAKRNQTGIPKKFPEIFNNELIITNSYQTINNSIVTRSNLKLYLNESSSEVDDKQINLDDFHSVLIAMSNPNDLNHDNQDIYDNEKESSVIMKINDNSIDENSFYKKNQTKSIVITSSIYESGFLHSQEHLCKKQISGNITLLILITSAPNHINYRQSIRQTWSHFGQRTDVAIGFIIGRLETPGPVKVQLQHEMNLYGDLIQANFVDSYNNLTLKTISILEWTLTYCSTAEFLLKTDDDMFINVPRLLEFIQLHRNKKSLIYGRLAKKWKPIRNKKSKYYVGPAQYGAKLFPSFTTGPAYLFTGGKTIEKMYHMALKNTYLKLEDVYTTGIVAQNAGINRIHVNEFLNRRIPFNVCNIRKSISIHMIKENEQYDLWRKLFDSTIKCK